MSFTADWFAAYSNLLNDSMLRARDGARKVRKGKYKADDYVDDMANTNLKVLELALKPYEYVLQPETELLSKNLAAATAVPVVYIAFVANVAGNAASVTATLTEKTGTGKSFVITAFATEKRDGLSISVPALSTMATPPLPNEIYEGDVEFGAAGAAPTLTVRLKMT